MERESILIHLNSENADAKIDNNTGNVMYILPIIEVGIQTQILLSIEHVIIPYSWYDINQNNNLLVYSVNGQTYQLTIDRGNYNARNLASYLTSNMANFTITYNKIKNKFVFTHATNDFTFSSQSTCFKLLGFNNANINSSARTLTSQNCINLQYTPCICIYSNIDSDCINKSSSLQNKRLFASIPVDVQNGQIIIHSNPNLRLNTYTNVLTQLEFQLCSIDGQILDMNNVNWSMTLRLQFDFFVANNV